MRTVRELPETNSSSSHTIVCGDSGMEDISQYVSKDGKVHLNLSYEFGWGWDSFNDMNTKLNYALGLAARHVDSETKIEEIKKLFEEVTGYELSIDLKNLYDDICIDHQGVSENMNILESKEDLKNFIFSPDSWLFTGNDNGEEPEGFYDHVAVGKRYPVAIATFDFPKIGKIDIEIFSLEDIESNVCGFFENHLLPGLYLLNYVNDKGEYFFTQSREIYERLTYARNSREITEKYCEENMESLYILKPTIWSDELGLY